MWDLPGPGLEPVSPASAGRFSTTAPPGKSPPAPSFKRYQLWKASILEKQEHSTPPVKRIMSTDPSPSLGSQGDQPGNKTRAFACRKAQFPFPGCFPQFGPPRAQRASHRGISLQSPEGRGSHGKCGLPAISFSKKGRIISPYLDLSAMASLSSCPQQTRGERNRKTPVKF